MNTKTGRMGVVLRSMIILTGIIMSVGCGLKNEGNELAESASLTDETTQNVISEAPSVQDFLPAAESKSEEKEDMESMDSTFSPIQPDSAWVLEDVISETLIKYNDVEYFMAALTRTITPADFSTDFKEANALYKAGEYQNAKTAYENILAECPVHLGARNNYVLTLVRLEDYDAALSESILLGLIHPSYEGNWVNILIPLYALGYDGDSAADEMTAGGLTELPEFHPEDEQDLLNSSDSIHDAFLYNYIYSNMEAEMGEEEMNTKIKEFKIILQTLKEKSPEDTDYSELLDYLKGLQKIRLK